MPSRRAWRASLREGLAYASRGELRVYAFSGTAAKRRVAVLGLNAGRVLLRVAGNLTPKQAKRYGATFEKVPPSFAGKG